MTDPSKPQSFPSWKNFYEKFKSDSGNCTDKCKDSIELALAVPPGNEYKSKICGACCVASKIEAGNDLPGARYNFLYYWIGDTVQDKPSTDVGDSTFKSFMSIMCSNMRGEYAKEGFNIICESIHRSIFNHRKKLFNFSYDYKDVKEGVQKSGSNCKDKWLSYLEGITEACETVRADCQGGQGYNKSYCTNFNSRYEAYCDMVKVLKQKCESQDTEVEIKANSCDDGQLKSQLEQKSNQLFQAQEDLNKATTTTALSSIFATLAVTALPFLLYKYTPVTSFIKNTLGFNNNNGRTNRRNRGRRSTESTFDTLTEDASTIGGDSTTGDDSATEYGVPSARKGRNNNSTSGHHEANIGHHHRNIGYGLM